MKNVGASGGADVEQGRTFSTLQHLLTLAHSSDPQDQQKAAVELSQLVEGTVFPAVSFGPLAHALSRLVPSQNRSVASYAARAVKALILDDALRPQAVQAGVASVVCQAMQQWEDEIICMRELLAAAQTLCWDKTAVKVVLQHGVIPLVLEYLQAADQEVKVTATATIANVLAFSDTLLLTDEVTTDLLALHMATLVKELQGSTDRSHKCYAAAAIANASAHPKLAAALLSSNALAVMREIEHHSLATLHVGGSKLAECAQTALYRLTTNQEGDKNLAHKKYRFKWGTKPVMELSLSANKTAIGLCTAVWVLLLVATFYPVIWGTSS